MQMFTANSYSLDYTEREELEKGGEEERGEGERNINYRESEDECLFYSRS